MIRLDPPTGALRVAVGTYIDDWAVNQAARHEGWWLTRATDPARNKKRLSLRPRVGGPFRSQAEVWAHVVAQACSGTEGARLALAALVVLADDDPEGFAAQLATLSAHQRIALVRAGFPAPGC